MTRVYERRARSPRTGHFRIVRQCVQLRIRQWPGWFAVQFQ